MNKTLLTGLFVFLISSTTFAQGICFESTKAAAIANNDVAKILGFSEFPAIVGANRLKAATRIYGIGGYEQEAIEFALSNKNVEVYEAFVQKTSDGSTYSQMFLVDSKTCGVKHLVHFKATAKF